MLTCDFALAFLTSFTASQMSTKILAKQAMKHKQYKDAKKIQTVSMGSLGMSSVIPLKSNKIRLLLNVV